MSRLVRILLSSLILLLAAGYAQADSSGETTFQNGPAAAADNLMIGTVVETMNADGFTYVRLENDGQTIWAAIRQIPVEVGQEIQIGNGPVRLNFTSDALGRTFDSIVFSPGILRK